MDTAHIERQTMYKRWMNDKQPDENGDYILVIENELGNRVSTFRGKSIDEITEALADSQIAANKQLGKLMRPDRGREAPLRPEPKVIAPADRLRLASEMMNPETVVEAVTEIVTAKQGIPPEKLGQSVSVFDQRDADAYYKQEAEAFVAEHPDYYPVQQNQEALFRALASSNYDLTRNNLAIVYDRLMDEGKIIPWPEEGETTVIEAAPPSAPPPAPRSRASGLRNSDANGSKPAPPKPKPIITRAELERMPMAEYKERLRDPIFRRAVDALA